MDKGLGLGINKDKKQNPTDVWSEVGGMVLWLDFSDGTIMKDSSNNPCTNGEDISEVPNKVKGGTFLPAGPPLGAGVQGLGSNPTFTTGGANGESYASFDASSSESMRASSGGNYMCIETNSLAPDVELSYKSSTFFIVLDPGSTDVGADMSVFSFFGKNSDGDGNLIQLALEADDDDWEITTWDGSGAVEKHQTNVNIANAATLITLGYRDTGDAATAGILYVDGDTGAAVTIDMSDGGGHDYDLDKPIFYDGSTGVSIMLGCRGTSEGVPVGDYFNGKLYEFIVYNRELSAAERTLVDNYLKTKYDIS